MGVRQSNLERQCGIVAVSEANDYQKAIMRAIDECGDEGATAEGVLPILRKQGSATSFIRERDLFASIQSLMELRWVVMERDRYLLAKGVAEYL